MTLLILAGNDNKSSHSTLGWALSVTIILLLVVVTVAVLSCITYIVYRRRKFKKVNTGIVMRHGGIYTSYISYKAAVFNIIFQLFSELSKHNYNDSTSIELSNSTHQESQVTSDQILANQISQSENHERFLAHVVLDLAHVPWELLNALKIFKVSTTYKQKGPLFIPPPSLHSSVRFHHTNDIILKHSTSINDMCNTVPKSGRFSQVLMPRLLYKNIFTCTFDTNNYVCTVCSHALL
jgi:hypothetical protein